MKSCVSSIKKPYLAQGADFFSCAANFMAAGPHAVGEGADTEHHANTGIPADAWIRSSADGWQTVATVGPYTLQVYEEDEFEDGTRTTSRTHELFYLNASIWKKSTTARESPKRP